MSEDGFPPPDMPLFGLEPGWSGARYKAGVVRRGPEVIALSLLHGSDVEGAGPQLVVETSRRGTEYWGGELRLAAEYLWRRADEESFLPHLDSEAGSLLSKVQAEERFLEIDGAEVRFRIVMEGNDWVARANHEGWVITIESRGFQLEGIRLSRVTDVSQYQSRPWSW